MSLRSFGLRAAQWGKQIFQKGIRIEAWKIQQAQRAKDLTRLPEPQKNCSAVTNGITRIFIQRAYNTFAAALRRRTAVDLMCNRNPLLGLVGLALLTAQHGKEPEDVMLDEMRDALSTYYTVNRVDPKLASCHSLEDYVLGKPIAKGCNAVVHEACVRQSPECLGLNAMSEIVQDSDLEPANHAISRCNDEAISTELTDSTSDTAIEGSKPTFPLSGDFGYAIKMMFNYEAASNATAILDSMEKEVIPVRMQDRFATERWENGHRARKKILSPHPNIVEMWHVFVDEIPLLPEAMSLYPDALPTRYNPSGSGRNMTLFLVMKRYSMTLRQYLQSAEVSVESRQYLLCQLLEGIVHLVGHGIAHRDLKSDNILISLGADDNIPQLVISDFGCCLAEEGNDLLLPYTTSEVSRGGNACLMAPEIITPSPGPGVLLDYSKADLWAAGTIAYEIFGQQNPFYSSGVRHRLDSRSYKESDLPTLAANTTWQMKKLISKLLVRDFAKRPTAQEAANMLHVSLWDLLGHAAVALPSSRKNGLQNWLARQMLDSILLRSQSAVEQQLLRSLLRRITAQDMTRAVDLLVNT